MLGLTENNVAFLIIGCVLLGLALIQIIFVVLNGKARKDIKGHTALGVLQILFGDLIAGILIIIRNKTTRTVGFVFSIITCVIFLMAAIPLIALSAAGTLAN
jgi:hypothetical protein